MLKPQDLVVVVRLLIAEQRGEVRSYPGLSRWTGLSASETHAAVKRAAFSGLVANSPGHEADSFPWIGVKSAIEEFLSHAIRYVFPLELGGLDRGLPTGSSVAGINQGNRAIVAGDEWVWPTAAGTVRGLAVKPLYRTVAWAASQDEFLHQALAAIDLARAHTHRLRRLGLDWLHLKFLRAI